MPSVRLPARRQPMVPFAATFQYNAQVPPATVFRFRPPTFRLPPRRTPIPFPATFQYNALVISRPTGAHPFLANPRLPRRRTPIPYPAAAQYNALVPAKTLGTRPTLAVPRLPPRRTPIPFPATFQYNALVPRAVTPLTLRRPLLPRRTFVAFTVATPAVVPPFVQPAKPFRFSPVVVHLGPRRITFHLTASQLAPQAFVQPAKPIRRPLLVPLRSNRVASTIGPAAGVQWAPTRLGQRQHIVRDLRRASPRYWFGIDPRTLSLGEGGGVLLETEDGTARLVIRAGTVKLGFSARGRSLDAGGGIVSPFVVPGVLRNYDEVGSTTGTSTHWGVVPLSDEIDFVAGDILLVHITGDNPGGVPLGVVAGDGWVELSNTTYAGDIIRHAVFAKIADGPGVDDMTITHANQDMRAIVIAIRDSAETDLSLFSVVVATGNTANPDPGSVTVAEGDLVIVSFGTDHDEPFLGGPFPGWEPSGYTQIVSEPSSLQVSSVTTAIAQLTTVAAGTENPGVFTMDRVDQWIATTIVFPGTTATVVYSDEPEVTLKTPSVRLNIESDTVVMEAVTS